MAEDEYEESVRAEPSPAGSSRGSLPSTPPRTRKVKESDYQIPKTKVQPTKTSLWLELADPRVSNAPTVVITNNLAYLAQKNASIITELDRQINELPSGGHKRKADEVEWYKLKDNQGASALENILMSNINFLANQQAAIEARLENLEGIPPSKRQKKSSQKPSKQSTKKKAQQALENLLADWNDELMHQFKDWTEEEKKKRYSVKTAKAKIDAAEWNAAATIYFSEDEAHQEIMALLNELGTGLIEDLYIRLSKAQIEAEGSAKPRGGRPSKVKPHNQAIEADSDVEEEVETPQREHSEETEASDRDTEAD